MDNFKGNIANSGKKPESEGSASVSFGRVIPTYAGLTPQKVVSTSTDSQSQHTVDASTLPPAPQSPPPYIPPTMPQQPQKPPVLLEWDKIGKIAGIAALVLLIIGGIIYTAFTIFNRPKQGEVAGRFTTVEIPLAELIGPNGTSLIGTRPLAINGTLQANGPVILSPSKQPSNAARGQIYYDQDNNQLAYFNGSQFVQVGATQQTTNVQSIGGQSGAIAVGEGLSSANGTLRNSGVLSLQGQTGNISLTAGNGMAIDGTTITNAGVTSLAGLVGDISVGNGLGVNNGTVINTGIVSATAGSPNITVTNDGNGNITISSVGGGTGTVQSPGGTAGRIAKFTGVQTLEDSLLSEGGSTVTVNGSLSVTGGVSLANALTVGNGGTGNTALATNGVVIGQGSGALTAITAAGPGLCFISTAGAPQFTACPGAVGVSSVNGQTGAVTIANASASGGTVTIQDAGTSQKGIASFNGTNFTAASGSINTVQNINVAATPTFGALTLTSSQASSPMLLVNNTNTSATGNLIDIQLNGASRLAVSPAGNMTLTGTINGQTISSAANFTGTLAVAGAATLSGGATVGGTLTANTITPTAGMTVGAANQSLALQGNTSTTLSATSGANTTTLAFQAPTANVTYRLLTAAAGTYDICTTAGNCAGAGNGVTTAGGTTNRLAKFTGSQAIGDSIITDNGTTVTIGGVLAANTITPTAAMTVGSTSQNLTLQGASTNVSATAAGITNTLTFATPSGSNKTITVPNASGTLVVSASGPLAIDASGNITCTTCAIAGSGVTSLNGLTGALSIANATTGGSTITIQDASTSQKGIAQFNSTNFSASSGTVNTVQNINTTADPTFRNLTLSTLNVSSSQATSPMALINNTNTGATGNLLDLQLNGVSRLAVTPAGAMTLTGTLNGQTISSAANFTGTLAVAGAANLNGGASVTGTLTANTITPTAAMTVGTGTQQLTLQGNGSSTLSAVNGANATTLAFQSPTANVTYRLLTAAAGTYDICTTAGNCSGVGGGVTTSGGTTNRLTKFTGAQTIGDSIITDNGSTVTIGGVLSVNTITPSSSLVVGAVGQNVTLQGAVTQVTATSSGITNTLTFATPSGSNKTITLPNASGTVAVSASGPLAIDANGNITCTTCVTSGGGSGGVGAVDSVNGLTGALTIANASGTGTTITINDATTSQKGIASFNSTNFSVTSGAVNTVQNINVAATPTFGALTLTSSQATNPMLLANNTNASGTGNLLELQLNGVSRLAVTPAGNMTLTGTVNGQTISSAASLTGTLAVAGATNLNGGATVAGTLTANTITPTSSMTIGATSQSVLLQGNASSTITATNGANTTTLSFQSPTANVNYRFATAAAGTYDICTTAGNCSGVGGSITGSGTNNTIAKFTGTGSIGNSIITDNGTTVGIGGTLAVNTITPSAAMTVGSTTQNLTLQGAATAITATSGATTNTLTFATPSGAGKTITIPNASGTIAVSASGPLAIDANGNITCTTCVTSTGVTSLNGLTGALTLANASGAGATVTINDASTSQKGIAQFNSTNFSASGGTINTAQDINTTAAPTFGRLNITSSQATNAMVLVNNTNVGATGNLIDLQLNGASRFSVTPAGNVTAAGTVNGQTISSTANFTGSLAVATNATVGGTLTVSGASATIGTASQAGAAILYDGSSNTATIQTAALGQNTTYILPDPGTSTATFCLTTGNCAGIGGGITGSGTTGKIAKFTASGSIGDSILTETSGLVSVAGSINISTGSTYQINGVQISSTALSNDANLAKLNASQTFTADNSFNGNVTLGDSAADTLTIGAVLQGATPLMFEGGTADANELSLSIGTLTGDRTVTLGDESGTVCLQSSTNCGFATTTGGAGYIQNQTAVAQLANFYIQSAAAATSPTAALRLASGQTGDLLEFQDTSGNIASRVDSLGFMHIDRAAATSDVVFTIKSTADTQSRLTISADGKIGWGSGSTAPDNFITRTVAGALEASNQFTVLGGLQVGAAGFLGKFTIQGGNTSTTSQVIRAVASQTADQIQLQDSAGNVNASFNNTGNQLTLGRIAASGTVTPGKIILADGTTSNFGLTIQTTTLSANRTITMPNEAGTVCLQGSTTCGFAPGSGSANYIQNTTTQQTANMNIISSAAGNIGARIEGAANMSAQALLVRSGSNPSANAFEVQNSSAGQLFAVDAANTRVVVGNGNSCTGRMCIGQSITGTGGGTATNLYNISSVSVSTGSTVVGHNVVINDTSTAVGNTLRPFVIDTTGTTNVSANINAIQVKLPASALGTALQIQNGATDVVNIANNGVTSFKTTVDSTTAFTVQGTLGVNVFTADTFNNTVRLRTAQSDNQATYNAIWLQAAKNTVTAMIGDNDNTSTYGANDFSGNLRWNGSNVGWGDIGYYPQGGGTGANGQFRFSTSGSTVNTTPNAKVGMGELYVVGNAGIGTNAPSYKLHVVGSAFASTSILAPLVDTASAGALDIGTTNATGINLNQNTTIGTGKTLTVTSGATSLTGATSGDALTVSNSTSTGNIAVFKDNATTVASIADGGATTFQNSANSTAAFRVLSQGSIPLFSIDTTNSYVYIGNPTADATGALLVLDTKNTAGDPTGVNGGMYYNSTTHSYRCYTNSTWNECGGGRYSQSNQGAQSGNSPPAGDSITGTTPTTFSDTYTVPANDCVPGRSYRITAGGLFTTNSGNQPFNITLMWGSTTIANTESGNATTPGATATNENWYLTAIVTCYTNFSGTMSAEARGSMVLTQSATSMPDVAALRNNTTGQVITTNSAQTLGLRMTWGSTGDTIVLRNFVVEAIGP